MITKHLKLHIKIVWKLKESILKGHSKHTGVWNDASSDFQDVLFAAPRSHSTLTQVHAYLLLARPEHLD